MKVTLEEFEVIEEAPSTTDSEWFNGWLMVEEGDWNCDYKYQNKTCIVQHVPTGKYYEYELSRTGSPYSDYYYPHTENGGVELVEVKPYEETVVIKKWRCA